MGLVAGDACFVRCRLQGGKVILVIVLKNRIAVDHVQGEIVGFKACLRQQADRFRFADLPRDGHGLGRNDHYFSPRRVRMWFTMW